VLAPTGLGLLTLPTAMLVYVYLAFVSKVGFAVVAFAGADAVTRVNTGDAVQGEAVAASADPAD
jgi:sensory rhodopsin